MLYLKLVLVLQALVSGSLTVDGQPGAGSIVTLTSAGGVKYTSAVDESGHFSVQAPAGTYELVAERKVGKENRVMRIPAITLEDGPGDLMLYWPAGVATEREAKLMDAFNGAAADLSAGRYDSAVTGFKNALTYDTAQAPVWASLALAYIGRKDYTSALQAGMMAIRFAPQEAAYQNNVGSTLFRLGRYADAIPRYEKAIALNPAGKGVYSSNIAACHIAMGHEPEAMASYRDALEDQKVPASAWYYYGALLQRSGNTTEATNALRKYLSLAPNGPYAIDADSRVRAMGG